MKTNKNNTQGTQRFVVFQSEWNQEMFRLDYINRISVDTEDRDGGITCVHIYINEDIWESFNGQDLDVKFCEPLHAEILKAINNELIAGSKSIDFDPLIKKCIAKFKAIKSTKGKPQPLPDGVFADVPGFELLTEESFKEFEKGKKGKK